MIIKDFNIQSGADVRQALITTYTYLTRSLSGTVAVLPKNVINKLNISNSRQNHSDPYILPGSDGVDKLKAEALAKIKTLIGGEPEPAPKAAPAAPKAKPAAPAAAPKSAAAAVAKTTAPKAEPKVVNDDEAPIEELDKEEKQAISGDINSGEATVEEEQKSLTMKYSMEVPEDEDPTSFDSSEYGLWGHAAYSHTGLEVKERVRESTGKPYKFRYTTNNGSHLDFDGLLPDTAPVREEVVTGFKRFQNLLSFFPDVNSEQFKQGMADEYILQFFYEVNPNWGLNDDGSMPDEMKYKLQNVYDYLIGQNKLVVESKAYVFGKKFEDSDRATGFFTFKEDKSLKPGDTLLLYGYRIYTKGDKTLNQYISIGSFPSNDHIDDFADSVPNGQKLRDKAQTKLEKTNFVVYQLKDSKAFKPKTGLRIVSTDSAEDFFDVRLLETQGVVFNHREMGLITSDLNEDGEFEFLAFMAAYEANGDEDLRIEKLKRFNKSKEEGGFVETVWDENGMP